MKHIGENYIEAIETYYDQNGVYPKDLYSITCRDTILADEFLYHLDSDSTFSLSFVNILEDIIIRYDSITECWNY